METKYIGIRTNLGCKVLKETEDPEEMKVLDLRLDLWNHSPSGLEWGYSGSGPAQTALALLADATGNDRLAVALHQQFKFEKIAGFSKEGFELTADEIRRWFDEHKGKLDLSDWEEEAQDLDSDDSDHAHE